MAKQSTSKGVTPEFANMSLDQIKKVIEKEEKALKKEYSELNERRKLVKRFQKLQKARQKVRQGINIKKTHKKKKTKTTNKKQTYKEYFDECIKDKKIPEDTPAYLRKAIKKAVNESNRDIFKTKTALSEFAKQYVIDGDPNLTPVEYFYKNKEILIEFLNKNKNVKVSLVLVCVMEQQLIDKDGNYVFKEDKAYFKSDQVMVLKSTNIERLINKSVEQINDHLDTYLQNGSGWYFKFITELQINVVEYKPAKGSSYIDLPLWIKHKKAIINMKNKDELCFIWCILRYLHPKPRDNERVADLRKYLNELNTKGIKFPMSVTDINKFEKLNPNLPGITVFSVEGKSIYPVKFSNKSCEKTIDLFLFEKDGKSHYSIIKNLHRLIASQLTKTKVSGGVFICKRCLCYFKVKNRYDKHKQYCANNNIVAVKMPKPGSSVYFKNFNKKFPLPFVIYADFECFTKPVLHCAPDPKKPYDVDYQKHEPSGFCFYLKGVRDSFKTESFTKEKEDDDVAAIFVDKIVGYAQSIYNTYYKRQKIMILTEEERKSFLEAKYCNICEKELEGYSVRDHCHFTGKYRGAAHNNCNLNCRKPRILPVIFHNLQGYDAHLFIKQLAKIPGKLDCIPSTEEKYISFSKHVKVGEYISKTGKKCQITFEIRFIDSFKFLQTSLSNLVSNLQPEDFINTRRKFKHNLELITLMIMFHHLKKCLRHSSHQKKNFIQS